MAADWKITGNAPASGFTIGSVGNGLALALGVLTTKVTSGLTFDGSGNITVKNGSGIAIDGFGNVTVNAGVGLTTSGGFLVVNPGTGLAISGSQVVIPGGAITNSLLAALAVSTSNIQAGAVTSTQIAAATITTANIANAAITTALIANAAITNALLGSAVVGTANIQNAAITTALIANLAVGNAQINDLAANKITAGTISAAISITSPTITSTSGGTTVTLASGIVSSVSGAQTCRFNSALLEIFDSTFDCTITPSQGSWTTGGSSPSFVCGWPGFTYTSGSAFAILNSSGLTLSGLPVVMGGSTLLTSTGDIARAKFTGVPQFAGTNNTGAGAASLGSNCPAGGSLTAPYTWIEVQAANGTLGWVPMWN